MADLTWQLGQPQLLLALGFGYLLGSIPFGLLLTRAAGLGDVRKIGSGNIGATNVLRTGNKALAAATLIFDALKGTAAVLIAWLWAPEVGLIAAFGALLGHVFPAWLGFRGGKGVATYLGTLAAVAWPAALAAAAIWLLVAALFRYSSLAALVSIVATPLVLLVLGNTAAAVGFGLMSLLVILKHHENIRRLAGGTESRIGAKA